MINLVPPKAKKSIVREYWVRVLSTWLILWSFALLCGVSLMFPTYVLIGSQASVYESSAEAASQKVADYQSASETLVQASRQAGYAVEESREKNLTDFIALFRSLEGSAIQISGMDIRRNEVGIAPVQLVGVATDRQALASFRDRLLEQPEVLEVDLPISNLARDRDIQFSISVVMTNQTES